MSRQDFNLIFSSEKYKPFMEYWEAKLSQSGESFYLGDMPSKGHRRSYDTIQISLDADKTKAVYDLVNQNELGVFITLTAFLNVVLSKYSGREDIAIKTPLFSKNTTGEMYAEEVVLIENVSTQNTIKEIIVQLQSTISSAYKFQLFPVVAFAKSKNMQIVDADVRLSMPSLHNALPPSQSLNIEASKKGNQLAFDFTFDQHLLSAAFIAQFARHFLSLFDLLGSFDTKIADINVLSELEEAQLIKEFNHTTVPFSDETVVQLFERSAALTPDQTALIVGDHHTSYQALNERVNQFAHYLKNQKKVGEGDIVAIYLNRSEWMVISVLAVLKTGAAYVPLDISYPESRVNYILENSGAKWVITSHEVEARMADIGNQIDVSDITAELLVQPQDNVGIYHPEQLAYIIYTSGSTGRPKGCELRHENFSNYIHWATRYYFGNAQEGHFGLYTSLAFDLTITSIFCALVRGKSLFIYPEFKEINSILEHTFKSDSTIDAVKITPAHIALLKELRITDSNVKTAIVGGDQLTRDHVKVLRSCNPEIEIYNEYGPTETTVGCMVKQIKGNEPITIGQPIANTQVYILDEHQRPLPQGVVGEIYIAGKGVGNGYHNNPDLTNEKFTKNLYHTMKNVANNILFSSAAYAPHMEFWKDKLHMNREGFQVALLTSSQGIHQSVIEKDITESIYHLVKGNDLGVFVTLTSFLNVLLSKYFSSEKVVIETPFFKGSNNAPKHAKSVFLIEQISSEETCKNVLIKLQKTIPGSYKFQDFPVDDYAISLGLEHVESSVSLFFDQVHEAPISNQKPLSIAFAKESETLQLEVKYDQAVFTKAFITQFTQHFTRLLGYITSPDTKVQDIELLSEEEKKQILIDFNPKKIEYATDQNIVTIFEKQVSETPDNIAVEFGEKAISFAELNTNANQLAHHLLTTGLTQGDRVAVLLDRTDNIITALLAILKAGLAYVPIDKEYPSERVQFILEDSGAKTVITDGEVKGFDGNIIHFPLPVSRSPLPTSRSPLPTSTDTAYIIYTSGSTGKPKGVEVSHQNLHNFLENLKLVNNCTADDVMPFMASHAFDISFFEIFNTIICGGKTLVLSKEELLNSAILVEKLKTSTVFHTVPAMMKQIIDTIKSEERGKEFAHIKEVYVGGDLVPTKLLPEMQEVFPNALIKVLYGPTENTIFCTVYHYESELNVHNIGKPTPNTNVYITDKNNKLCPIHIAGEILLGGSGVAKQYLNREELTKEKFSKIPFDNDVIYKTGDLGRWNENGEIEFIGRKDNQVKIRGYRIELGEIENTLLTIDGIQEAVVLDNHGSDGIKYLSAFLVAENTIESSQMRTAIADRLPEYMIPSYFTKVDQIPLTVNGKIDRKKLLSLEQAQSSAAYVAPATEMQEKLVELWKFILGKEKIGINDDFFELGGHSLRATQLIYKINQALHVNLEIRSIFLHSTVKKLAEVVASSGTQEYNKIKPISRQDYYDLSNAQRRIWVLSQLEDASVAYNQPAAFTIEGRLDVDAFSKAYRALIDRHEILRTVFTMVGDEPKQKILRSDDADFSVQQIDISSEKEKEKRLSELSEKEANTIFDLSQEPLIKGKLIHAGEGKYTFFLTIHHIISDGWSMGVIINELFAIYNAMSAGEASPLSDLTIQYKDFAAWQNEQLSGEKLETHQQYWMHKMRGEIPVLQLPTDFQRPKVQTFNGDVFPFEVDAKTTEMLKKIASNNQGTLFMSLLSAINILMQKYSGQEDIIIGSPIAGRDHADLENQIGLYMNVLALRNQFSADDTFVDLFEKVKQTTFDAFEHQNYPFDKLVTDLELERDLSRSPLFDVVIMLQNLNVTLDNQNNESDLHISHYDKEHKISKFDLTFVFVEHDGGLKTSIEFNTDIYSRERIVKMSTHLQNVLNAITENQEKAIKEINCLSDEEIKLLETFNTTSGEYPADQTIVQLFENQVNKTPDTTALVFNDEQLTYTELNHKANQLAHELVEKGVQKEELIGIFIERSTDMIVGLLGIMKAGAAYVPLDPNYPQERVSYIMEDAGLKHIITQSNLSDKLPEFSGEIIQLDKSSWTASTENPAVMALPSNLAYVIYTSGSTGKPKGVLVEHKTVVNFFTGMTNEIGLEKERNLLAVTTISFDISVLEMFWTLTNGFKIVIQSDQKAPAYVGKLTDKVSQNKMDFSLFYFASGAEEGNKYKLLIEGAKFADQHGFSAIWTPERHFHDFGGIYPNPSVTGAAVATITENIQIRSGSCVLPLHNPIRVAEEWSVVDNLSNGRVGLSFASGWVLNDFLAFAPGTYEGRHKIMYDDIEKVKGLWRGESINLAEGNKEEHEVRIYPQPIQKELPIWVTAAGNPETFRSAGAMGANLLTHLLGQSIEELGEKIKVYREARKEAGHEGGGIVSLMIHTFVAETVEEAKEKSRQPFKDYLKSSFGLLRGLAKAFNMDIDSDEFNAEDMDALLEHAFNRYYNTAALLGSPDSCLELVNHLGNIGVDELGCLMDFGIPSQEALGNLKYLNELKEMFENEQKAAQVQPSDSLTERIKKNEVNYLQCTPSMMKIMLTETNAHENLKGLKKLLLGGEALPQELVDQIYDTVDVDIHNMYGPTETTIWSTTAKIQKGEKVTIGKPILNTQIHILDPHLKQVPIGVHGEIYIAGDGVTRGYLHRPELTEERFINHPYGDGKLYKTGDLGKWLASGKIEYIGRNDEQVKIRGHRIELGEIETKLKALTEIEDAVVMAKGEQTKELVGYIISPKKVTVDALKTELGKSLPEYMIPNYFVRLSAFPLTPNGKIDKKKLPDTAGNIVSSSAEYEAPVTRNEQLLAKAWQELLGIEKVGINDSFFTIGGDSIKAIQVVSRLRQEGLKLEVRDIFNNTTIKELAKHVKEGARSIDQQVVTGEYALTPIQYWHFDIYKNGMSHYNHAVMLKFDERIDSQAMQKAVSHIYEHHDVLRTRFQISDEKITGHISAHVDIVLELKDLSNADDPFEAVEAYGNEVQASLNLTDGPLIRVAHIQLADSDRLLIVIHHLLVDGISWRVIFEDVDIAYKAVLANENIKLPLKTDSFVTWSNELQTYAESEFLLGQKDFWHGVISTEILPIKVDHPNGSNVFGDKTAVSVSLSKDETTQLLGEAHKAYNTEINDLLLTGFALAMREWQGHQNTLLSLEGHGREDIGGELDVSRTIGWFTGMFPVSLKLTEGADLGKQISRIKEGMRKIPNKGIGFGVLNYLTNELQQSVQPEIIFNYLGQFDTDVEDSMFQMAEESVGAFVDATARRPYILEINGVVSGGQLTLSVMYSKHQFQESSIEALLEHYRASLTSLIDHCMSAEDTTHTVSDFAYQDMEVEDIGVEDLDDLFD